MFHQINDGGEILRQSSENARSMGNQLNGCCMGSKEAHRPIPAIMALNHEDVVVSWLLSAITDHSATAS